MFLCLFIILVCGGLFPEALDGKMKEKALAIVTCVLSGIAIILSLYCLFKNFNLSRKVHTVSDFLNGEVFSGRFHTILSNYFANPENTRPLLEPLRELLRRPGETATTDQSGPTQNFQEVGGFFLRNEVGTKLLGES